MMKHQPGQSGRISISGLSSRGWTKGTIREFLGEADWIADNPHYKIAEPMRLYDLERVERAEEDPWFQRRRKGGKNSRSPIPAEDINATGTFRNIPPAPLNTQRTAFEQREAVAQAQHALGVTTEQIAGQLGVSTPTVRRYLRTPEQRERSAAREQSRIEAAERARQKETQRQQHEKEERALRHQVRLSARALHDAGMTADEIGNILGIEPNQAGKFIRESGVKESAVRWTVIPQEELDRIRKKADRKRERKTARQLRMQNGSRRK